MALFTRDQFSKDDDEAGIFIGAGGLGSALITWAAMQDQSPLTVALAAAAFNTTPAVIREAIDNAMWIGYFGPDDDPTKQNIELDGE